MKIWKKSKKVIFWSLIIFNLIFISFVFYHNFIMPQNPIVIKASEIEMVNYSFETIEPNPNVSEILQNCRQYNYTDEKVECMIEYARKYIKKNQSNPLYTLDEILTTPTNCIGFSNFYSQISNMIGLNYKSIDLWYNDKGHRIGFVLGEHYYCIVNLYSYKCWSW